jgi:hypothetical protein
LKTKDPNETYWFSKLDGTCLFSQYLKSFGHRSGFDYIGSPRECVHPVWTYLHKRYALVATEHPMTFGAALERAEERLEADACA